MEMEMEMEGRESTVSVSVSPTNTETTDSPSMSGVVPQVMNMAVSMSMNMETGGGGVEMLAKKKRGRPRKYGPDGSPLSPSFYSSSSDFPNKRARGRPAGSGSHQLLESLGGWILNSAGGNFTPHVVTINTGEDVAAKIMSFSHKGPRAICILSANGAVSNVTIRQPGSSGGLLTYEGRFEILALSGSYTISDNGGGRSRTGGLSVSLAGPDGRVIGGGVAGNLLAASPIQVIVGSFMPNIHKSQKRKYPCEPSIHPTNSGAPNFVTAARPISQATPEYETCAAPMSSAPEKGQGEAENIPKTGQNLSSTPSLAENVTKIEQNRSSTPPEDVGRPYTMATSDPKPSPEIHVTVPGEYITKL